MSVLCRLVEETLALTLPTPAVRAPWCSPWGQDDSVHVDSSWILKSEMPF